MTRATAPHIQGEKVTDRTSRVLVCVYYRVAAGDSRRVISGVREFQRTLQQRSGVAGMEVLLRCDLPLPDSSASAASLPDAPTASAPSPEPPSGSDAQVAPGADATVMETYLLPLPASAGPDADAVVRAFLAALESAAAPLAGLLRGARHVELFAPCVS
jgi:hypothetical protein